MRNFRSVIPKPYCMKRLYVFKEPLTDDLVVSYFFQVIIHVFLLSHTRSNVRKHCYGEKKIKVEFLMDIHVFRTFEYERIVFLMSVCASICLYL
jgi:hypothetical protein